MYAAKLSHRKADLGSGAQLFVSEEGKTSWKQITEVNKQALADVRFGEYETVLLHAGAKGEKVYGYVMKPWNAKAGENTWSHSSFTVVQSSFANAWSYRWNPRV